MSFLTRSIRVKNFKNIIHLSYYNSFSRNSLMFLHISSSHFDSNLKIKMPSLSPTMTEGTIVKWLKKEGDSIAPGDTLCEIQTDKAVVGFEIEEEGVLHKILVPEDTQNIKLGEIIAEMIIEGEVASVSTESCEPVNLEDKTNENASFPKKSVSDFKLKLIGPSVRNLLKEYGIEYSVVTPSGPQNNLLKGDVLKYIKTRKLKPQIDKEKHSQVTIVPDITFIEEHSFVDVPHSSVRQMIAKQATESKSKIPHAYMSIENNMNSVLQYINLMKAEGLVLSVNDFLIKCVADALVANKEVNVIEINNEVKSPESIDISFNVATDNGFVSPILKNANLMNIQEISSHVEFLTQKAIERKLETHESEGRSFSLFDLGMYGVSECSAIITYPQGAMLTIGRSKLVVQGIDEPPINKIKFTLSYDSRIIDQESAARFLQCFKEHIENPFSVAV